MKNQETIEILKAALEVQPDNEKLRLRIAEMMLEDGDHEGLSDLFSGLQDADAIVAFAAEYQSSSPSFAISLADLALEKDKACADAYLVKAVSSVFLGDDTSAKKWYGVATVIDEKLELFSLEERVNTLKSNSPKVEASAKVEDEVSVMKEQKPVSALPQEPLVECALESDDCGDLDDFVETDSTLEAVLEHNLVSFQDVGGMEALKERIRMSIIYPFQNREMFAKFKKRIGGGILLYGPPGCGKTLISKATAGECGAHFINISIHDILSKWIGESEQRVHELFETARRKSPTIIFIDEIDALCVKRSDAGRSASLVNTFLTEIDGAASRNEDVLVIGATNTPWRVDSAFRRPGRFDHVLFVPPPDKKARESIFELALDGIPQEEIDVAKLAKISEKFSGADIAACVQAASEVVITEIMKTGKELKLTEKNIVKAVKKHKATTLEWLSQASNYASYSNQAGLYDELADYINGRLEE